jgi:pimeloyl-ACP methyl ester carboxylesterase
MVREVNRRVGHVIERLEAGDDEAGARLFVGTVARRPGAWEEELTAELRAVFIGNAPTFLDEARDPDGQHLDLDQLRRFDRPALLTKGTASPLFLRVIVDAMAGALPGFEPGTIDGGDHAPHQTASQPYVDLVRRFAVAARVSQQALM